MREHSQDNTFQYQLQHLVSSNNLSHQERYDLTKRVSKLTTVGDTTTYRQSFSSASTKFDDFALFRDFLTPRMRYRL
jgi:hypothetical protein